MRSINRSLTLCHCLTITLLDTYIIAVSINFHCIGLDIVHLTNSCHWIGGFQCFDGLLHFGHLLNDSVHQFVSLLIDAGEIDIQFPAQQQSMI